MPEGVIDSETFASLTASGTSEMSFFTNAVDPNLLLTGENVIAVEVHQRSATSSDLGFDFELYGEASPGVTVELSGIARDRRNN